MARGCAVPLTASGRPVRKDAFDKTWRRRNPILLLIATPWHVSKAMMARAGAQETENAPSAVRPDKRLPRCTGGKTFCRPFIGYFFPPQRLWVDYSRFPPSNSRAMRPSRFASLTIVKLRTRFAVASPATLPKAGLVSPSPQKVTDCTG